MLSKSRFLPRISEDKITEVKLRDKDDDFFELLTQPLHNELYRRQTFDFLEDLSPGQQMFLSYDYIVGQVKQGGFIQFLQNGYVSLLAPMPGWLESIGAYEMSVLLDDVLKAYVKNVDKLEKETTVEEFARLYNELPEFSELDSRFEQYETYTLHCLVEYASKHLEEYVAF
jgi:Domain of unknown function (DUF4375)